MAQDHRRLEAAVAEVVGAEEAVEEVEVARHQVDRI
jgi:hypothetical protein